MVIKNLISIITPAYNAEKYIAATIDSVIAQTYSDWEMIVVDDGSTDNTKNIVNDYVKQDSRIKYIYQENASQAVARNTGIKYSNGEFIAFLDADDIWMPDKLEKQMPLFANEGIGLVHSDRIDIDSNSQIIDKKPRGIVSKNINNSFQCLLFENFITTSTVLLKRSLLVDNNLFFRVGRKGVEDWDLWLRIFRITQIAYCSLPLVRYRTYQGNTSSNYLMMHNSRIRTLNDIQTDISKDKHFSANKKKVYFKIIKSSKYIYTLRYAHILLDSSKKSEARKLFKEACQYTPVPLRPWWGLFKSFFL